MPATETFVTFTKLVDCGQQLVNTCMWKAPRDPERDRPRAGDGWQGSGGQCAHSLARRSCRDSRAMRLPLGGKREAPGHLV
ncbi:hypothetical protein E4U31_002061 [Claviceps sp. LM219 group G6]|nr:hypothetical protein E4U31_002061 [Claviceps sp. LM219 group G6]